MITKRFNTCGPVSMVYKPETNLLSKNFYYVQCVPAISCHPRNQRTRGKNCLTSRGLKTFVFNPHIPAPSTSEVSMGLL